MPYGPYSVASWLDTWAQLVLSGLGLNADAWRMEFLEVWSHFETAGGQSGTGVYYNPLGTTYPGPGHSPNVGGQENVWHFDTVEHGAYATAMTIVNYPSIVDALANEHIPAGLADAIGSVWGTGGFASQLRQGWAPSGTGGAPAPIAAPSAPQTPPVTYLPPGPYASIGLPPVDQGYLNIPQSELVPGQLNYVRVTYGGIVPPWEPGFWTYWEYQGNGFWREYNSGDRLQPTQLVGLLPPGLSLPGGLTAREESMAEPGGGQVSAPVPTGPVGAYGRGVQYLPGPTTPSAAIETGAPIGPTPAPPVTSSTDVEGSWRNYIDWSANQTPAYIAQLDAIAANL